MKTRKTFSIEADVIEQLEAIAQGQQKTLQEFVVELLTKAASGIKPGRKSLELPAKEITDLYHSGKSMDELANDYGCGPEKIRTLLKSNGATIRKAGRQRN